MRDSAQFTGTGRMSKAPMENFMTDKSPIRVCFAASSGGHLEQLRMLSPLMDKYDSFVVTEKTPYADEIDGRRVYYLYQVNRKEHSWIPKMCANVWRSLKICMKEKPEVVVSVGVMATIPICLLTKLRGGKLIYIESFAKVTTTTMTGRLLHVFADQYYVQWEQMLEIYPDAICLGGIY